MSSNPRGSSGSRGGKGPSRPMSSGAPRSASTSTRPDRPRQQRPATSPPKSVPPGPPQGSSAAGSFGSSMAGAAAGSMIGSAIGSSMAGSKEGGAQTANGGVQSAGFYGACADKLNVLLDCTHKYAGNLDSCGSALDDLTACHSLKP